MVRRKRTIGADGKYGEKIHPFIKASFPETLHGRSLFLGTSRLSIKLETLRNEHVE
jgi:hypothetical protein